MVPLLRDVYHSDKQTWVSTFLESLNSTAGTLAIHLKENLENTSQLLKRPKIIFRNAPAGLKYPCFRHFFFSLCEKDSGWSNLCLGRVIFQLIFPSNLYKARGGKAEKILLRAIRVLQSL